MTTETLHWISWGLTTTGVILWVYWSGRSSMERRIAVIEKTKADKNNGMDEVKATLVRVEQKIDDLPCKTKNWNKGDCE